VTGRKNCGGKPFPTHHPNEIQRNNGWSKSGKTRYIPQEFGESHCTQSLVITSSFRCQQAAKTLGMDWKFDVNRISRPYGCYRNNRGDVYFNKEYTGSGSLLASPICRRPKQANGYDKRTYNIIRCGAGTQAISTETKCRQFARKKGKVFAASAFWLDRPSGCLLNRNNKIQFNKAMSGRASPNHSPVCKRRLRCRCTNDRKAYKCGRSKYPTGYCKSWQTCNKIGQWNFPSGGFAASSICTY